MEAEEPEAAPEGLEQQEEAEEIKEGSKPQKGSSVSMAELRALWAQEKLGEEEMERLSPWWLPELKEWFATTGVASTSGDSYAKYLANWFSRHRGKRLALSSDQGPPLALLKAERPLHSAGAWNSFKAACRKRWPNMKESLWTSLGQKRQKKREQAARKAPPLSPSEVDDLLDKPWLKPE